MWRVVKQMARFWMTLLLSASSVACMSDHDSVVAETNPTGWDMPVTMTYANVDTVSIKEAALLVRYDNDVCAGEVVIEAHSPTGAAARDTIAVTLLSDQRSNNIRETRLPYRTGVVLGEAGEYRFTLIPLTEMRGVWSVGIDFEKE
jgi:hypothetical protein